METRFFRGGLNAVNSVGNEARCFLDAERMRKDHAASGKMELLMGLSLDFWEDMCILFNPVYE